MYEKWLGFVEAVWWCVFVEPVILVVTLLVVLVVVLERSLGSSRNKSVIGQRE